MQLKKACRLCGTATVLFLFSALVVLAALGPLVGSGSTEDATGPTSPKLRFFQGKEWARTGPVTEEERLALREEARDMFFFGFNNYMHHAFPKDDLRPISCRGSDSQGGIGLTLLDTLDTLLVMGADEPVRKAVSWVEDKLELAVDARVHVFEVTIRAIGGLLSTHVLIERKPELVPGYSGEFLRTAVELGERLLPAFDTPSGIPLSWVNLKLGVVPGETRTTCTACAGTLLLEFGLLSRVSGNPVFERKARDAVIAVYDMRHPLTGLLGNTLDVDTKAWVRRDSGIGAGLDSFYEYLLKAYLLFGDESYLDMFTELYVAAMRHMRLPGAWAQAGWLADVSMDNARLARPWVSSLGAFWPGMQVLAGQIADAAPLHANWTAAWRHFEGLPELFDVTATQRHPIQRGYPLRPELMESTFLLYSATCHPVYLQVGRVLQATLADHTAAACGYASIADVATREREDTMESFFLAETSKYLFLLHADVPQLPDFFILSTEGHLLPALPAPSTHDAAPPGLSSPATPNTPDTNFGMPSPGSMQNPESDISPSESFTDESSGDAEGADRDDQGSEEGVGAREEGGNRPCREVCWRWGEQDAADAVARVKAVLPLVGVSVEEARLIRQRRCRACTRISRRIATMRKEVAALEAAAAKAAAAAATEQGSGSGEGYCPMSETAPTAEGPKGAVLQQMVCHLQVGPSGSLVCGRLDSMTPETVAEGVDALPPSSVILQLRAVSRPQEVLPLGAPAPAPESGNVRLGLHIHAEGPKGETLVETDMEGPGSSFGPTLGVSPACEGDLDEEEALASGCIVKGPLVRASPSTACKPLEGGSRLQGAVVVLDRGGCMFIEKVTHVALAGGAAAVIVSHTDDLLMMSGSGQVDEEEPAIPSLLLSQSDGHRLLMALEQEREDVRLTATLRPLPDEGGDDMGDGTCGVDSSVGTASSLADTLNQAWATPEQAEAMAWAASMGAGSAGSGVPAPHPNVIQTQVEVLLPPQSHGWLQEHADFSGNNPMALLTSIIGSLGSFASVEAAPMSAPNSTPLPIQEDDAPEGC